MADATRPPTPPSDAAEVFATFVEIWCQFGDELVDALVEARITPGGTVACEALLRDPMVVELIENWHLWEEWTGVMNPAEGDARLAAHLPPRVIRRIRFALWGWSGTDA